MPLDISLAVGDGARRMTYAELAAVRGVSALSAERLVRRKHWPRQVGNDGVVHVLVPLTEARKVGGNRRPARSGHPPLTSAAPAPDVRGIIREVIREISDAAPPDDRDDIREDVRALEEREKPVALIKAYSVNFETPPREYHPQYVVARIVRPLGAWINTGLLSTQRGMSKTAGASSSVSPRPSLVKSPGYGVLPWGEERRPTWTKAAIEGPVCRVYSFGL